MFHILRLQRCKNDYRAASLLKTNYKSIHSLDNIYPHVTARLRSYLHVFTCVGILDTLLSTPTPICQLYTSLTEYILTTTRYVPIDLQLVKYKTNKTYLTVTTEGRNDDSVETLHFYCGRNDDVYDVEIYLSESPR